MDEKGILWLELSVAAQEILRQRCPARYPNAYYHHVTLQYGIAEEAVDAGLVDQPRSIEAYAEAYNSDVQAVRIHAGGLPDTYGVPHITLSTNAGIKPYASVAMLQNDHTESPLEPPLILEGTVRFKLLKDLTD